MSSAAALPPLLARALKFVPAAMLTALVLPMVVTGPMAEAAAWTEPKFYAALLEGAAALCIRGTLKSLGIGMAALWLRL